MCATSISVLWRGAWYAVEMAGSLKDALEKSGRVQPEIDPKPSTPSKEWLHELPAEESRPPYVPFDAPAITKIKETKKSPSGR